MWGFKYFSFCNFSHSLILNWSCIEWYLFLSEVVTYSSRHSFMQLTNARYWRQRGKKKKRARPLATFVVWMWNVLHRFIHIWALVHSWWHYLWLVEHLGDGDLLQEACHLGWCLSSDAIWSASSLSLPVAMPTHHDGLYLSGAKCEPK